MFTHQTDVEIRNFSFQYTINFFTTLLLILWIIELSVVSRFAVVSPVDHWLHFITLLQSLSSWARCSSLGLFGNNWLGLLFALFKWLHLCRHLLFCLLLGWGIFLRWQVRLCIIVEVLGHSFVELQNCICEISDCELSLCDCLVSELFRHFNKDVANVSNNRAIAFHITLAFWGCSQMIHDHNCLESKPISSCLNWNLVAIVDEEQLLICTNLLFICLQSVRNIRRKELFHIVFQLLNIFSQSLD